MEGYGLITGATLAGSNLSEVWQQLSWNVLYKEVNYKSGALKEINLDIKEKESLLADDCQNAKILSKTYFKFTPFYFEIVHPKMEICSPMDPLQWMGAVRMRVQTADKNITIIHK